MSEPSRSLLRFGDFELDPAAGELFRNGQLVRSRPQQLQLLSALLRQPGRVVTRSELQEALWSEQTFVEFEDGLNHAIIRLRSLLGDSAQEPRFIETVPRRGYRFIAPVETRTISPAGGPGDQSAELTPHAEPTPAGARRIRGVALGALAGIALLGAALLAWRFAVRGREAKIESLVILPLSNLTGDPGQEFLSDGVTEDLTTQLARIGPLRVVSRTSAMRYKGTRKPLAEIGRELSVDAAVEGAVQRSAGRIRITVQLIEASTDRHLWAKTYEGAMKDVLALEARATRDIARHIRLQLTPQSERRLRQTRTVDPDAYDAYQKGQRASAIPDRPHLQEAVTHFEEAVRIDPDYALAYAQLAHAHGMLNYISGVTAMENSRKLRDFTGKALELDNELAEAHVNLGDIRFYGDWDWSGGEAEFRRAVELDRGSVDAQEHYALCLWAQARYADATREMRRALELDPLSPRLHASLGRLLIEESGPEAAIRHYTRALELEPGYAQAFFNLSEVYEELGRDQEAMAAYLRALGLSGESPETTKRLNDAFESGGMRGVWSERLRQLRAQSKRATLSPLTFSVLYVRLGQYDAAFDSLDGAFRQHIPMLAWVNAGRPWAPLRSHPRFQSLRATMRFPTAGPGTTPRPSPGR